MSIAHDVHDATSEGQAGQNGAGAATEPIGHPPIQPLMAVGVVVTKAALLDALRLYVPQLLDLEPIDDDRFFLRTAPDGPHTRESL
jgi:hypothetical protein